MIFELPPRGQGPHGPGSFVRLRLGEDPTQNGAFQFAGRMDEDGEVVGETLSLDGRPAPPPVATVEESSDGVTWVTRRTLGGGR